MKDNLPGRFGLSKERARVYGARGGRAAHRAHVYTIGNQLMTVKEMAAYFGLSYDGIKYRIEMLRKRKLGITEENLRSFDKRKKDG